MEAPRTGMSLSTRYKEITPRLKTIWKPIFSDFLQKKTIWKFIFLLCSSHKPIFASKLKTMRRFLFLIMMFLAFLPVSSQQKAPAGLARLESNSLRLYRYDHLGKTYLLFDFKESEHEFRFTIQEADSKDKEVLRARYTQDIKGKDKLEKNLLLALSMLMKNRHDSNSVFSGVWHRRGVSKNPISDTHVGRMDLDEYIIYDNGKILQVTDYQSSYLTKELKATIILHPYAVISDNEYHSWYSNGEEATHYVYWINKDTYSDMYTINNHRLIMIMDRGGLSQSMQALWGTNIPVSPKQNFPLK